MTGIRALTEADTSGYGALWQRAVEEHAEFFRSTFGDDPSGRIPTAFRNDSFTLGAFSGDVLLGIVSLDRDPRAKLRHKALVSRMFVDPAGAGRGIGKALLDEVIARALTLDGLRQLYLTVLDRNERARALYAAAGFQKYAHEPGAVCIEGEYLDEWQMVLVLERQTDGDR